jgi:hypothetical protein
MKIEEKRTQGHLNLLKDLYLKDLRLPLSDRQRLMAEAQRAVLIIDSGENIIAALLKL